MTEAEEEVAVALSKGASVEAGVHTAELVPERRPHGGRELILKLVILLVLLAVPLLGLRAGLVGDVNGDGKVDIVDLELILAGAGIAKSWPAGAERTAHA